MVSRAIGHLEGSPSPGALWAPSASMRRSPSSSGTPSRASATPSATSWYRGRVRKSDSRTPESGRRCWFGCPTPRALTPESRP
eukprot:3143786-Alexandrium_andersonii.AAC.1